MDTLTLRVDVRDGYDMIIEPGVLDRAGALIRFALPRAKRLFVVTDTNVSPLYGPRLVASLEKLSFEVHTHVIPAGESSKRVGELAALWEWMAANGITRTDGVVALGGGVVGDLAGFAASTVLRGVDLVQIPTTLLAQVDSSVGGKTAIDLEAGKNLAGSFWQPRLVLTDPQTLETLPDRDFSDGMAEVIKYGCVFDRDFFDTLAALPTRAAVMGRIGQVIYTCCDWKRSVVAEDERDTGRRMLLNFGHTVGHAFEKAGGYSVWTHGQAVAAGMAAAIELGAELGVTQDPECLPALTELLRVFDLPTRIECPWDEIARAVGLDKKSAGDAISMILLEKLGRGVAVRLDKAQVLQGLERVCGRV